MNSLISQNGLESEIVCDSAGILDYHKGEPADQRMQKHAKKRGYRITSISRPVYPNVDFDQFDMIIGMDDHNIRDLSLLIRTKDDLKKIHRMTDFCRDHQYKQIPDPYYGGEHGFELVLDILEDACTGLLDYIRNEK